jgi:DtxR family transcriptional regulator, Mn-dependent transcriptional regulator
MIADLSKSEREALKAIYRHTKHGVEAHTGDLAETLGVTPGTVTATVKRLADRGLVDHRPYHGVSFTDDGRRQAVAAIRRHRIVERFLADQLAYSWSEADRLAPTFEHELPDEVEDRMFQVLGNPATCPHGFPIPTPEQDVIPEMPSLYDLVPGDVAEIALPSSTEPAIVRYLDEQGVRPGVRIEVVAKHPFDGPLVLLVDEHERTLGERIARHIYVRPVDVAPPTAAPVTMTAADEPDLTGSAATSGETGEQPGLRAAPKNGGSNAARTHKEGTRP